MTTSVYKMGGDIVPETLDLINSKINKINAYNRQRASDSKNKTNGDCEIVLKERKNATEYTKNGCNDSVFNKKIDVFFKSD